MEIKIQFKQISKVSLQRSHGGGKELDNSLVEVLAQCNTTHVNCFLWCLKSRLV